MGDFVGIIKELREGERVSFDTKSVVSVVLVKEVDVKGLFRRSQREVPTALMYANVYATSMRLLFLVFYQWQGEDAEKANTDFRPTEMAATWFAIPVESIQRIETRALDPNDSKDVRQFLQKSGESDIVDRNGVELVYGGRELTEDDREMSQSLLGMGALQRLTSKAEGMSDKVFIGIDQASLLASSVQAAMGVQTDLETPELSTQQFSIMDPQAQQATSDEEPESQQPHV